MGKLVDITVCGAGGRMGRRIVALAEENGLRVTGALEAPGHPALGQDAGLAAGVAASGVTIGDDLKTSWTKGAVIVDFSSPAATLAQLEFAAGNGAPVVVGTTGLDPEQRARAEELAARTATVMASNMSVGITVLDSLVEQGLALGRRGRYAHNSDHSAHLMILRERGGLLVRQVRRLGETIYEGRTLYSGWAGGWVIHENQVRRTDPGQAPIIVQEEHFFRDAEALRQEGASFFPFVGEGRNWTAADWAEDDMDRDTDGGLLEDDELDGPPTEEVPRRR